MSEDENRIYWKRMGNQAHMKFEYIQKGTAGTKAYTFFMPGKDPRSLMQKWIDWFSWMFLDGPRIVYIEHSGKVRWIFESKKKK